MTTRSRMHILVAEDDPDDRELVREAFAQCGITDSLHFMQDGEEVTAFLAGRPPEHGNFPVPGLLLLDLNMPRKDGLEVLRELRASAEHCNLPAIVLSTSSDPRDIAAVYRAGANSFITKPSSYDALVTIVRSLTEYWLTTVALPEKAGAHGC